jgi:hypothetical protein
MYAAHFAAGLAIKSHAPKAPTWALLVGVFLPDFFWVAFGLAGIEPSQGLGFFDDWSHSLAMVLVWAALFSLAFLGRGFAVVFPVWLAVFSHFLLDLPIHPKNLALYPHSSVHLGWGLWGIGPRNYWWVQLGVLVVLILVYAQGARRLRFASNLILASCIFVLGLHIMTWR